MHAPYHVYAHAAIICTQRHGTGQLLCLYMMQSIILMIKMDDYDGDGVISHITCSSRVSSDFNILSRDKCLGLHSSEES